MDEAREFAFGEYLLALTKGNRLTPREVEDVAKKMVALMDKWDQAMTENPKGFLNKDKP